MLIYNDETTEFTEGNLTDSFNFKLKITGRTGNDGTKDVEINGSTKIFK